jgi:hypothetical protein
MHLVRPWTGFLPYLPGPAHDALFERPHELSAASERRLPSRVQSCTAVRFCRAPC